jgi:dienelactone hydrolase
MRAAVSATILAFVFFLGAPPLHAAPIAPGPAQQDVNLGRTVLTVFTYRPANCAEPTLLIVFHGLNRNADRYRGYAQWLADNMCMIVVAPLFDAERFPTWRYQRGGVVNKRQVMPPSEWTLQYIPALIQWSQAQEGRPMDVFMIGHSAGGQFASRLAAFLPTVAKRVVVANPSTHVFPTLQVQAPYGFGGVFPRGQDEAQLRRYLAAPVTIFLGEEDTGDENRNDSQDAMQQGATRLERGRNAFAAGRAMAQQRGWAFNWRLVELPGVGHSARKMFESREAVDALRP